MDVIFYNVDEQCTANLHEIEKLANTDTLGFLWVHYFGYIGDVAEARSLANRLGILMIEDCAHSINAKADGKEIGSHGHASIFSLWKTLRTADGAMLIINEANGEFRPLYDKKSSCFRAAEDLALKSAKEIYNRVSSRPVPQRFSTLPPTPSVNVDEIRRAGITEISPVSKWWISRLDVDAIASKRRNNFRVWQSRIKEFSIFTPLFKDLKDEVTPFSFPVLVAGAQRHEVRQALAKKGIVCGAGFPEAPFETEFEGTRKLAENLLELPVHQAFTSNEFNTACEALRAWRGGIRSKLTSPNLMKEYDAQPNT
jgi:dTDP-4-amino-4,6-dideoxygalactose transaminase